MHTSTTSATAADGGDDDGMLQAFETVVQAKPASADGATAGRKWGENGTYTGTALDEEISPSTVSPSVTVSGTPKPSSAADTINGLGGR